MNEKVCLSTFHFTLLMVSFLACVVWAFNNFYKFSQCQNSRSSNGIDDSILAPLLAMLGVVQGQGQGQQIPDPDMMDDLAVGTMPTARRDYRKMADPLKEPSRRWTNGNLVGPGPPGQQGPFNIQTQGYYPSFQMMGYLNNPEDPDRMLKLFGRRKDSYRYEYYTMHHDDQDIKIPLKIQGDRELSTGDTVKVPGFGDEFKVNTYDYESPQYIPGVF